jgi:hypothetical protein
MWFNLPDERSVDIQESQRVGDNEVLELTLFHHCKTVRKDVRVNHRGAAFLLGQIGNPNNPIHLIKVMIEQVEAGAFGKVE